MVVSAIQKVLEWELDGTQMLSCIFETERSGKEKLKSTVKVWNSYR